MPRSTACSFCRQNKIRCDVDKSSTRVCTNCSERGLRCVIDGSFKRVPARRDRNAAPIAAPSTGGRTASVIAQPDTIPQPSLNDHNLRSGGQPFSTSDTPVVDPASQVIEIAQLETVTVTRQDAERLFSRYLSTFHPHFPVIDAGLDIWALRQRCPLLFWTIIAKAGAHEDDFVSVAVFLQPLVPKLVQEHLTGRSYSLAPCQALLILCIWPFQVVKQREDVRWLYSGMAMQMATLAGLHKYEFAHEYVQADARRPSANEQNVLARTWYCCCLINAILSAELGLPPMNLLNSIDHSAARSAFAQNAFCDRFLISIEQAKINAMLHDACTPDASLASAGAVLEMAINHMDNLKHSLQQPLDNADLLTEFMKAAADMNVQAVGFNYRHSSSVSLPLLEARKRALASAMTVARLFPQIAQPRSDGFCQRGARYGNASRFCSACIPKHVWKIVLAAGMILVVSQINNDLGGHPPEIIASALEAIKHTASTTSRSALDESMRVLYNINILSRPDVQRALRSQANPYTTQVQTRLGASVAYGLVYSAVQWRKRHRSIEYASPRSTPIPSSEVIAPPAIAREELQNGKESTHENDTIPQPIDLEETDSNQWATDVPTSETTTVPWNLVDDIDSFLLTFEDFIST